MTSRTAARRALIPRPARRPPRGPSMFSRRPSDRRRLGRLAAAVAVAAVAGALVGYHIERNHPNTTFNEIAIQPRPDSPATVAADVSAELAQAAADGGQLLVVEIGGRATAAPALDINLSCPPGMNTLICGQTVSQATRTATNVDNRLVSNPAPADLDIFAVFEQTAGYLSENPAPHQAINLWINTTGAQLSPVSLAGVTTSSNLAALAQRAVAAGAFPGPHQCQGYAVHMIVPPSGSPSHQQALRELLNTMISRCGGSLISWTARWIAPNPSALALPQIAGARVSSHAGHVRYTVSERLDDFAVGSAALTTTAQRALDQIAQDIEARAPGQPITCTGSTDGTGTAAFDKALSVHRAVAVCDYLAHRGLNPRLLRTVGAGKATPTAANPSLRRVVISVRI